VLQIGSKDKMYCGSVFHILNQLLLLLFINCNGFKFLFGNQQCQEDRCTWLDYSA